MRKQWHRHGIKLVTIDYTSDNCGAVTTELRVTSRDPDDRGWRILDAHHVLLRVGERGRDDDDDDLHRRYSIAIVATDEAGNRTVQAVRIRGFGNDR